MAEQPEKFGAFDGVAVVASALRVGVTVLFMYRAAPSILHVLADFGGRLPLLTRMALSRGFMGAMLLLDAALVSAGAAVRIHGKRCMGRGLLVAGLLLSVLIVLTAVVGTYLPLFMIADAVRE